MIIPTPYVKKGIPIPLTANGSIKRLGGMLIDDRCMLSISHVPVGEGNKIRILKKDGTFIWRHVQKKCIVGSDISDLSILLLNAPVDTSQHDIVPIAPVDVGDEVIITRKLAENNKHRSRKNFISKISHSDSDIICAHAGNSDKSMLRSGDSGMPWLIRQGDDLKLVSFTSRVWMGVGPNLYAMRDSITQVREEMLKLV